MNTELTQKEKSFCELFVGGTAPYAGNAVKCYSDVFGDKTNRARIEAKALLAREDIQAYVSSLEAKNAEKTADIKRYLTQNLMRIIDETSTAEYRDRRGTLLSPAPLRSVAVNASKALMDMYPVKEAQTTNLNIGGGGEGGVTFNVIVPEIKSGSETENAPDE